jgi:hypothetical protein
MSEADAAAAAQQFAVQALQFTMGEYSVLNRPPAWRSGIQSFLYMYKVFPTTSVQMFMNLSRGGKVGMIAGLWLLSGLAGLPFAEDLEDLADTLAQKGFRSDAAQLGAIEALERCEREWADYKARRSNALTKLLSRPPIPRGVYMHGGVGRGKSFLMDCFFQSVPLTRKTRLHFHEFMREVHRELQDLKGTVNPLDELGRRIARRFRLICFDEFHVADVTDAMILHRLLESLFANRVSIGIAGLCITVSLCHFFPCQINSGGSSVVKLWCARNRTPAICASLRITPLSLPNESHR